MSSSPDDLLAFRYLADEMTPAEAAEFEARLLDDEQLAETLADTTQLLTVLQPAAQTEAAVATSPARLSGGNAWRSRMLQAAVVAAVFVCGLLVGRWTDHSNALPEIAGLEAEQNAENETGNVSEETATLRESGAEIATAWLHLQALPQNELSDPLLTEEAGGGESYVIYANSDQELLEPHVPAWLIAAVQSEGSLDEDPAGVSPPSDTGAL